MELTRYYDLTEEDRILGSWGLAFDVQWLRGKFEPIAIFNKIRRYGGREVRLDLLSDIQTRTPERALAREISPDDFCHVRNLCETYLRFATGRPLLKVVWRMHYLWYLESLQGTHSLSEVTRT